MLQPNFDPLVPYGWNERVLTLFNTHASPGDRPARVVRAERGRCVIVDAGGDETEVDSPQSPAVGEWLLMQGTSIVGALPRWSELARGDPNGSSVQVLAANVDLVAITVPADRLNAARVERELAIAWDSGAQPLVILTKADLGTPDDLVALESRLGVDVLATSAAARTGLDGVAQILSPNRTAVLLGPSGAGKSTLANALIGIDVLATGAVRGEDQRGRHTTTSRQLVVVPGGGVLIDTPGLRSLSLTSQVDLGQVFPDIEALAGDCRFSDCRHESEPDCAVSGALNDGRLDPGRLASFRKLQREAMVEARRSNPLLRKAEIGVYKARTKAARAQGKRKGH